MNRNITAVILIVLAAGIYFTVTRGMIADAQAVKSVNDQYSSAIANAEQLISVRDQVQKDSNDISADDQARLDKMIPDTVDNIRLIIDLNSVAERHGFSLTDIKAAADSTGADSSSRASPSAAPAALGSASGAASIAAPTLDTVDVSFSVTAPYDQFISFLQDLEASLRIMDVTSLSVTASDSGAYTFSVQLKTYWLRQ
jgi:Tfp pilus assembly protein PilO